MRHMALYLAISHIKRMSSVFDRMKWNSNVSINCCSVLYYQPHNPNQLWRFVSVVRPKRFWKPVNSRVSLPNDDMTALGSAQNKESHNHPPPGLQPKWYKWSILKESWQVYGYTSEVWTKRCTSHMEIQTSDCSGWDTPSCPPKLSENYFCVLLQKPSHLFDYQN